MKKFFAGILSAVMLLSSAVFSTSAAGTLVHSDNFDMGFSGKNWMHGATEFKWNDGGYIYGYADARVLESKYGSRENKIFDKFYTSFDVKVCAFDDVIAPEEVQGSHILGFWYRDLFENEDGSKGAVYQYFIEVETGIGYIIKSHEFSYRDENNILQHHVLDGVRICEGKIEGEIPVGEDAPYVNIGLRVTDGRIEGYFNEKLVCYAEVDPEGEKLGDTYLAGVDPTVGSQKSPILFWSGLDGVYTGKLFINLDNFEVWTADYDFVDVMPGDVNGDEIINLNDVSKLLQYVAKWEVEGFNAEAADVTADGTVNLTDAARMLQYIAKWDVVLGPTE